MEMLNKREMNREEYLMWEALDSDVELDNSDDVIDEKLAKEIDEWNHPDNIAYRNRNGCEFENETNTKLTIWEEYTDY